MTSRRNFLLSATAAGALGLPASARQGALHRPSRPGSLIVPSGHAEQGRIVNDVRVFHLTAGEVTNRFAPGLQALCWGFNGVVNGPVLEAVEGERVRIYVTNRLPAPTSVHWHGFILPNGMDGVSGLTQPPIPPGETWVYDFRLIQHGTHMFHSHEDTMTQDGLGLTGMFVIHPRESLDPPVDRDFVLLLHEWRIDAGARRPNPNVMSDFNVLTMNGKVFPALDPLVCRTGQRVRMRIGNLSAMDHHPIHVHGVEFEVTAIDGARVPVANRTTRVTVLVGVGETRDIEFAPQFPGDWAFHCHMTHHMMNQMGHDFPNMIGVDAQALNQSVRDVLPDYMTMGTTGMRDMTDTDMPIPPNSIPMLRGPGQFPNDISLGGMAGVLKVRDDISDEALAQNLDPGWYQHPPGTRAQPATTAGMLHDGIDVAQRSGPRSD
ncbi:MAG: copper oxidase [Planctomycetota bacterium]